MMRHLVMLAISVLGLALPGCGDAIKRMLADPSSRARLMDGIGGDSSLTGEMIEHLLSADGSRAIVFEHVLANGQARQALLVEVARDQMLLDGVIQFAVQDSPSRTHILTLFKGMQMTGAK